jgi:hypothetical protein
VGHSNGSLSISTPILTQLVTRNPVSSRFVRLMNFSGPHPFPLNSVDQSFTVWILSLAASTVVALGEEVDSCVLVGPLEVDPQIPLQPLR